MRVQYTRQEGIIPRTNISNKRITLIGAGGIGSFTALTLAKMGVGYIHVYDEDGITPHNLPNQFFRREDIDQFKVDALKDILGQFSEAKVKASTVFYTRQLLEETVIVGTDSMASRRAVWEQFKKQPQCKNYIEARMGAELGLVYTIRKKAKKDIAFYEATLYDDNRAEELPCTARAIIYNVGMISSLICRAYKAIVTNQKFPREVIFNMTEFDNRTYMIRN